jgi:hypothetical protein
MRYHKSSTTSDLIARGPSKIAMMVASEFWRANAGAEYREEAERSLWRARELMGVLEVLNLPETISHNLLSCYAECSLKSMFSEERLTPSAIQEFSSRLGEIFDLTAEQLRLSA